MVDLLHEFGVVDRSVLVWGLLTLIKRGRDSKSRPPSTRADIPDLPVPRSTGNVTQLRCRCRGGIGVGSCSSDPTKRARTVEEGPVPSDSSGLISFKSVHSDDEGVSKR